MTTASKSTLRLFNLKILKTKVKKNLTNFCKKFCKFPPSCLLLNTITAVGKKDSLGLDKTRLWTKTLMSAILTLFRQQNFTFYWLKEFRIKKKYPIRQKFVKTSVLNLMRLIYYHLPWPPWLLFFDWQLSFFKRQKSFQSDRILAICYGI